MVEREEILASLRETERMFNHSAHLIWERYKPTKDNLRKMCSNGVVGVIVGVIIILFLLPPPRPDEVKLNSFSSIALMTTLVIYFLIMLLQTAIDEYQSTGNNTEVNDSGLTPEQKKQKYHLMTEDEILLSIKWFTENNDHLWNADPKFLDTMPSLDLMPIEYLYAFIYGLMKVIESRLNARLEKNHDLEGSGRYSVIRHSQASEEFELLDRDLSSQLKIILDKFNELQHSNKGKISKSPTNKSLLFQVLSVLKKHKLKQKVVLQRSMANGELVPDTVPVIGPTCYSHSPDEEPTHIKSLKPSAKANFLNRTRETNTTKKLTCTFCDDVVKFVPVEMSEFKFVRQNIKHFTDLIEDLIDEK